MSQSTNFDDLLYTIYENAYSNYKSTPQYEALQEKQEELAIECKRKFINDDYNFITTYIDTIVEIEGSKLEYMYKCGIDDCISILKKLQIL